jgi:hypothetical protein
LSDYEVVNVGAAGTFVVRKPGSRARFRAELLRKLPFEAEIVLCAGSDLIRMEMANPFGAEPTRPDIVRFVSILSKRCRVRGPMSITVPPDGEWFLRIMGAKNRFVFGVYRRHMKTIGYLGQIDKTVRCAGHDTELEHHQSGRSYFEGDAKKRRSLANRL